MKGQTARGWELQHVKPDGINFIASAGTTAVTSDYIGIAGFHEIIILGTLGAMVATGTCDFKLTICATSGGTYVDSAGSALSQALAAVDANTKFGWDIFKVVGYNFIKTVCTRATANVTIEDITAVKMQARKQPRTQSAGSGQFVTAQAGFKFLNFLTAGTP